MKSYLLGNDDQYEVKVTIKHDLPFFGQEKPLEATYYTLENIPMNEVFDTHKENYAITSGSVTFYYKDSLVAVSDTPYSLIKQSCDKFENPIVITMKGFERERLYKMLNQNGNILHSTITIQRLKSINHGPFYEDLLNNIFSFLELKELVTTSNICVFWHMVTQKLSLLTQMNESDFAWIERQSYPEWLEEVSEMTWKIMISSQENKKMSEKWKFSNLGKSPKLNLRMDDGRPQIAKAMGCSMIKSVKFIEGPKPDHSLQLYNIRNEFFSHFVPKKEPKKTRWLFRTPEVKKVIINPKEYQKFKNLEILNITDAHPKLQSKCIEMFQEYFSPEIQYLFPLIVFKQKKEYLNFSNVITWMIFGGDEEIIPFGACSFRLLKKSIESKKVENVCEVLFIGVWEKLRNQRYGSELVKKIEEYALKNDCGIFYVEISDDQPLARDFWKLNEFEELKYSKLSTDEQLRFFNNNCLRFRDTTQFVKKL
eukprot:gene6232-10238_t